MAHVKKAATATDLVHFSRFTHHVSCIYKHTAPLQREKTSTPILFKKREQCQ